MKILGSVWTFIVLNILVDIPLTRYILAHGGIELSPIIQYIISNFGYIGLVVYKVFFLVALHNVLIWYKKTHLYLYLNILLMVICALLLFSSIYLHTWN